MFGKVLDKLGIKTRKGKENAYGYIFILPWLIGILCFTLGPMIFSLITSFTNYNMLKMDFTGLANYKKMFFQDRSSILSSKIRKGGSCFSSASFSISSTWAYS